MYKFRHKKTEVKKGRQLYFSPKTTKYPLTQFKPLVCFDAFYAAGRKSASSNAYINQDSFWNFS